MVSTFIMFQFALKKENKWLWLLSSLLVFIIGVIFFYIKESGYLSFLTATEKTSKIPKYLFWLIPLSTLIPRLLKKYTSIDEIFFMRVIFILMIVIFSRVIISLFTFYYMIQNKKDNKNANQPAHLIAQSYRFRRDKSKM